MCTHQLCSLYIESRTVSSSPSTPPANSVRKRPSMIGNVSTISNSSSAPGTPIPSFHHHNKENRDSRVSNKKTIAILCIVIMIVLYLCKCMII